jgi:protease IV
MNTKILSLLLIPMTLNCFSLHWFSKSQQLAQPHVMVIEMYDPINFKECAAQLFRATKDTNVVGVILMMNSRGGETCNFSVIHDMVKKLTDAKPVVCLVMGSALSGGYMVASAATVVLAHTLSEVGSIGTYVSVDRYKNTRVKDDKIKADLKVEIVKAGEFKALFNPYLPELTESQRSFIQAQLMREYDDFINLVVQNRNLKKDDYKVWAEGKKFDAVEALELGLIDGIGTIFHVEEMIKGLVLERNPHFGQPDAIEIVYP